MANLEDLIHPARVHLDDDANAVFRAMIKSEIDFVDRLRRSYGATSWQQLVILDEPTKRDYEFRRVPPNIHFERRRYIVLVPQEHAQRLLSDWPKLIATLAPARDKFREQVKDLAVDQNLDEEGKGDQSTKLPVLVDDGRVVEKITTTIAAAFRAGALGRDEIIAFMKQRRQKYLKHVENAERYRKKQQEVAYSNRLGQLENEILQVDALFASGRSIVARRPTRYGVHLRFKFADGTPSLLLTPTSITVAVVKNDEVEIEAPAIGSNRGGSRYGDPILTLEEAGLYIYAAD